MKTLKCTILLLIIPLFIFAQEVEENILENQTYKERMLIFKKNPLKKGQIIFFGNSITQAGRWASYFPSQSIANRGISGDNTEGMLARIYEVIEAKPAKIFIMAGINDISLQRSNETILRQMKMLLRQIKAGSPETQIYVQSTLPLCEDKLLYGRLKEKGDVIEAYNHGLKILCDNMELTYIDIYSLLLIWKQNLNPKYTSDGLHINKEAYAIWADEIRKHVEQQQIN